MRTLVIASSIACLSGCLISGDNFGAKNCHADSDCPQVAGYFCASGLKWPQEPCGSGENECICEVIFPPTPGGIGLDGGGPKIPDAGPPPDYCTQIKPVILFNCVQTCHGSQMQVQNAPTDFRLDYWDPGNNYKLADGGNGLPGISSKLDRIDARMYTDFIARSTGADPSAEPMPPYTHPIQPSRAERDLVHKWINTFHSIVLDGGCEVLDAGRMMGNDAGTVDAGVDAGLVSFSAQILPIFNSGGCNCHTGANTSGGLSLTAANAYNQLVNVNVSANCAAASAVGKRVVANNPQQSQLWLKLKADPAMCPQSMPRGGTPLAQQGDGGTFGLIERWIREGARNN